MSRVKFQTLTEQMFYILLCLQKERCGIDIMDQVAAVTDGRVRVGSGTLYPLLDEFLEAGIIQETSVSGRKRSYRLTAYGQAILRAEYERICRQAADYRSMTRTGPG